MFYDKFKDLCTQKGISCNKAALEIGLSNATPTKWRKTGATPVGETLDKIADYFGVTTDFLLGKEQEKRPVDTDRHPISDDDIKFALFGGSSEITDAMYEEVKQFAAMVRLREEHKKKD